MKLVKLAVIAAALASTSVAFAQGITRDDVRAQLVQAEQNGSQLVTDASYPDVSPIYRNQVARAHAADTRSYGGRATAWTDSGARSSSAACVGPYSFCNLYAGS